MRNMGYFLVGLLGAYFHVVRGTLPTAPFEQRVTISLLIWAPPISAPFAFAGIGLLGISAAWQESPTGSGVLTLPMNRSLSLPYSKTRAYLFMISLGILVALISSALDHARHGFQNPWFWLPFFAGVFATVVSAAMASIEGQLTRTDLTTFLAAMLLLIIVGLIGTALHIRADLTSQSVIVPERFLRGAPFMSPLLFANMGILGVIALLSPEDN